LSAPRPQGSASRTAPRDPARDDSGRPASAGATRGGAPRLAPNGLDGLLALALRASSGRHAEAARNVVLTILFAQLLAGAGHEGPPHASAPRPPRRGPSPRPRHAHRTSVMGRRPRG
jgi:hypothetical protein